MLWEQIPFSMERLGSLRGWLADKKEWQIKTGSESKQEDKSGSPLESKSFSENYFLTVREWLTEIYPENNLFPQAEAVVDTYPVQD